MISLFYFPVKKPGTPLCTVIFFRFYSLQKIAKTRKLSLLHSQSHQRFPALVLAAFFAASERLRGPFVFTAFFAASDRSEAVLSIAASCAWRDNSVCDTD